MTARRRGGPPEGSAASERIDSGFALENADAPFLHAGLNLADIAHVLDLLRRGIVPRAAARDLLRLLLEVQATDAAELPYDPEFGDTAVWLHAGRPRREAARIALRIYLRDQLLDLVDVVVDFVHRTASVAAEHVETLMPD